MTAKTALKLLTRDEILAADDRATEVAEVPEWGGSVTVRALSGIERDQYERSLYHAEKNDKGQFEVTEMTTDHMRARLVSRSLVDDKGDRLFTDKDLLNLSDKAAAPLNRIFDIARRLSGLTDQDIEALKSGLKASQNGTSGSDSPETSG